MEKDSSDCYKIEELLDRLCDKLPETDKRKCFVTPDAVRVNKTTVISNFGKMVGSVDRPSDLLKEYIQEELVVASSVNARGQLILQGFYKPNQIKTIFIKFIKKYIKCSICGSCHTKMIKESRFDFVVCDDCKSKSCL
jgi:translation initiation factor 2 subunit 2